MGSPIEDAGARRDGNGEIRDGAGREGPVTACGELGYRGPEEPVLH
jgi:hypothetical protein